ncbi:M3 family metallopeptidase [Granulicella cerasi]|uniref:M3 family metallopeptidase n=1 Tax=Granulicella cerasi TaxID=741063 RepID=A0ABW1ZBB0_9BACT|nr:M3 family metallopeptidase [Granulicella cerasi]
MEAIQDTLHLWANEANADAAKAWVEHHLSAARELVAALTAETAPRTVANTLERYDRACWHLRMAGSQAHVMFMVHPLAAVRDAAQELSQVVSAEGVALSLNRDVYDALAAVDVSQEDERTRFFADRALLGYRLAGVDRDEAIRIRIGEISEKSTMLAMQFSRAVQDDVRTINVIDPEQLRGLPADYLMRKGVLENDGKLTAEGPVTITTDPPDLSPVMSYAASRELRRELYLAYNGRGYPQNKQVLLDLLALRQELAEVLGFRSYADLATVDQMMGSAAKMREFLASVEAVARPTAQVEYAALEKFVAAQDAAALPLTLSDARFWEEQYRRAQYDFDSQSVRPYFPYEPVQQGILRTAGKFFAVRFERDLAARVWDPSVEAYSVFDEAEGADKTRIIGRIYLDMHPREGKSKWFSECSLVGGLLGTALPEASLVCNFPQPTAEDPGLMQYADVVTYFHEFGHLMHEVLGGARQRWASQSGIATEGDFVEVPSQMLEEFFEDPELLRTFAKHYETGEPIPYDAVARMTRAAAHGRGLSTLTQVMYATYSMETHDRRAAELDLDTLLRDGYDRFSRYEFVDGNRMYAAFTHLIGYTSNYYTYLFDKVIALEFFAQFPQGEIGGTTALKYRHEVLEPGGSKPAADLVKAFLGRETSMNALQAYIEKSVE